MKWRLLSRCLLLSFLAFYDNTAAQDQAAPPRKRESFPNNRLRSFYADQAQAWVRSRKALPDVLPAFPGLDGGSFGHWGQYPEASAADRTLNDVDRGGLVSTVTRHFGATTTKAVVVGLGSKSALFDPARLSFTDVWQGKLVRFGSSRFGLLSPTAPDGKQLFNPQASGWQTTKDRRYLGFYRHGKDVAFAYRLGAAKILDHASEINGYFARTLTIDGKLPKPTSLTLLQTGSSIKIDRNAKGQTARFAAGNKTVVVVSVCATAKVAKLVAVEKDKRSALVLEFTGDRPARRISLLMAKVGKVEVDKVVKQCVNLTLPDATKFTKGGASRWSTKTVATTGKVGRDEGSYAIDTLTLPYAKQNPFRTPFRLGGVGFLPDGRCVVATLSGDVWLVDGVDDKLEKLVWKRIAAGLHQPLGLTVQDGKILVTCRDQITRLHDLNGDDEADFYECVTNDFRSTGGHNFVTCLHQDKKGNLYFSSAAQGVLRFNQKSDDLTLLGSGLRYTNGMGVSPDGDIVLATCQEGNWTPACGIYEVKDGSYHGWQGPRKKDSKYGYDLPLCFLPRGIDHSAGGLTFVPKDRRFGPLSDSVLGFSFGNCSHYLVLREEVDGTVQGGVVPLPGDFLSGSHRAAFNPHDGHVYVAGTAGWQSYAKESGCLQRLRYTGKPMRLPTSVETYQNGLLVRFNCKIDPKSVDRKNVFCEQWNYLYNPGYGSPEYSARQSGRQGHDPVEVRSVHLLSDGRSLFVEIPHLHPVMQFHLYIDKLSPVEKPGTEFVTDIYYSIYKQRPAFKFPGYKPIPRLKRYPDFPRFKKFQRDPRLVAQERRGQEYGKLQNVVPLKIKAVPGLRFDPLRLRVPPGRRVSLTIKNVDINMQHNFVLVQKDRMQPIGEASMMLAADPQAIATHYVPKDPGVMCMSPVLNPGDQYTIYFDSPKKMGAYPFICTFPGHWRVMRGVLYVLKEGEPLPKDLDLLPARKFVKMWKMEDLAADATNLANRSFDKGRKMFDIAGCSKCHVIAGRGTKLGPDLTDVRKRYQGAKLLEQILKPSSEINKEYQAYLVATADGKTTTGLRVKDSTTAIHLLPNPLKPKAIVVIPKKEIEAMRASKISTMPKGLLMTLAKDEILDLLFYVQSGGRRQR